MIRFRCHRCKRPLAVPDRKFVGKKVKCPGCSIVTIVPDIPGAQKAKARMQAQAAAAAEAPAPEVSDFEVVDSDVADTDQVYDDPLAALAGAADGFSMEDETPLRSRHQPEAKPRRPVRKSHRDAGTFMFFGAVLVIAAIVGAAATALKATPDDQVLYFCLSGGGGLVGLVLFIVGLARA